MILTTCFDIVFSYYCPLFLKIWTIRYFQCYSTEKLKMTQKSSEVLSLERCIRLYISELFCSSQNKIMNPCENAGFLCWMHVLKNLFRSYVPGVTDANEASHSHNKIDNLHHKIHTMLILILSCFIPVRW